MRGAGATPVDVRLQIGIAECHSRWTTIDDAAHSGAVAFAKRRDREELAYGVARHVYGSSSLSSMRMQLFGRQQKNPTTASLKVQPGERNVAECSSHRRFRVTHLDD